MILTILIIIIIFSALIIAHEFGHFIVARRNGVKVDEFGIGFPPKIFSKTKGGTEYSINLLPLGGFVRLKGEDGGDGRTRPLDPSEDSHDASPALPFPLQSARSARRFRRRGHRRDGCAVS